MKVHSYSSNYSDAIIRCQKAQNYVANSQTGCVLKEFTDVFENSGQVHNSY